MTFTVEFSGDVSPPKEKDLTPGVYVPTVVAEPEVETGMPYYGDSNAMETASVAKPTSEPYVHAYAAKLLWWCNLDTWCLFACFPL